MKKFITEVDCFHNGRYYEAGQTVECDCKYCQEEKVPYFKKVEEDKTVSRETNTDEKTEEKIEEKIEVKEDKPKKKNKLVITE